MARKRKVSEEELRKQEEELEVEPGDDVAEAQPSIEKNTGGGTSGSIQGGANNAPGEQGGGPQ